MKKNKILITIALVLVAIFMILFFLPIVFTTIQIDFDALQIASTIFLGIVTLCFSVSIAKRQEEMVKEREEAEKKRLEIEKGVERKENIRQIISWFLFDKDINDAFYMIEYGGFCYPNDNFHGSELERKIDKTLTCLNYICDCLKNEVITDNHLSYFKYHIIRVMENNDIKEYFCFLNSWFTLRKFGKPYPHLQDYVDIFDNIQKKAEEKPKS